MKKMNNKGFAISSLLYGLLLVAFLVVTVLMSIMASNRKNTTNLIEKIDDELSRHSNTITEFPNNTDVQEFIVPYGMAGWYKIELWGAAAYGTIGDTPANRGSYVSGLIYLDENDHLYFYIGATGLASGTTFNQIGSTTAKGGGATDARIISGGASWNDATSKSSIIMLAGGGGNGGTFPGSTLKDPTFPSGGSYISGFNGQAAYTNAGVTYKFVTGKMFHSVNGTSGKAKIELVSKNPKTNPPAYNPNPNTTAVANYIISLSTAPGRVLTAVNESAPARFNFYDGRKKQKWTISKVVDGTLPLYKITEGEDNRALQPALTDNTGYFEPGTNVSTLGTYNGNIWEQWQIVSVATDTYMIKSAKDPSYCVTVKEQKENANFLLQACDPTKAEQKFKLYNADF